MLQNVAISFDNDLNRATYGVTASDILGDADGQKVGLVSAAVTAFSDVVARLCAAQ